MLKIVIFDFDGTLTLMDTLDLVCSLTGGQEVSRQINESFLNGEDTKNDSLIRRIRLLKGISLKELICYLDTVDVLRDHVDELISYLKSRKIKVAICSGNIIPIIEYFSDRLHVDYYYGTNICIKDGVITGEVDGEICNNFKQRYCEKLMAELSIKRDEVAIVGDSLSDVNMMELSDFCYFIQPKNRVEYAGIKSTIVQSICSLKERLELIIEN